MIHEKQTFRIHAVTAKPNPKSNASSLQMTLYPDTKVEPWDDMKIEYTYVPLADAKKSGDSTIRVKCIACNLGEEGEKTRGGEDMRRAVLMDGDEHMTALFIGKALVSSINFQDGAILKIDGRLVDNANGGHTIFVNTFEQVTDDALSKIWMSTEPPPKRIRVESTIFNIIDIKSAEVGTKGEFTGVVRSCTAPMPVANDRVKRTFTIVDQSMAVVDVGLFTDKTYEFEAKVGSIVKFGGTVSSFNTRSLTTKTIQLVEDESLAAWWTSTDPSTFEEISIDPRTVTSVA